MGIGPRDEGTAPKSWGGVGVKERQVLRTENVDTQNLGTGQRQQVRHTHGQRFEGTRNGNDRGKRKKLEMSRGRRS